MAASSTSTATVLLLALLACGGATAQVFPRPLFPRAPWNFTFPNGPGDAAGASGAGTGATGGGGGGPSVPAMFVFGDSLTDNGNNNDLTSLAKANYLPYGIDFAGGPTGRFSNGYTMVDAIGTCVAPRMLPCAACMLPWPFSFPTGVLLEFFRASFSVLIRKTNHKNAAGSI